MLQLRFTSSLTPVLAAPLMALWFPGLGAAATTVSAASTTPLATSTAGDITVSASGSITTTGQPAITVDTSNAVTIASGGTLTSSDGNGGGGISQSTGTTSTISNAGTISVVENYTVAPITGTTVASGPIADTTGRYGILVAGTAGGSIANSGTIGVKGIGAVGIGTLGQYTGTITNTGTIAVKGDGAVGLALQGVTGDVIQGGAVTVVGSGSQGLVAGGDIGGTLTIAGAMSQATSYTTDAGTTQLISAAQLNASRAMVEVDGSINNGINIFAPCSATTVGSATSCVSTGSTTTTGSISSAGNNPALQIGGVNAITIGAGAPSIAGGTWSLAVDGTLTASATFSASDATALSIGGKGGSVALPGGIGIAGTITATTFDSTATGVLIGAGSTVGTLSNSGTIKAAVSQAGGTAAYGVRDLSGTLTTVINHGTISATAGIKSAALDLSANTSGVTYTQSLSAYEQAQQAAEQTTSTYNPATAVVYTSTTGDILTGSGDDSVAVQSGTVTGNGWLGGGNDAVSISGDGRWTGDLHFGTGTAVIGVSDSGKFAGALFLADQPATLTIAGSGVVATSSIAGGSQLSVTVNGGTFGAGSATTLALHSLTVNSGGAMRAWIAGAGASSLVQADTATFNAGSKVSATISSLASAAGTYHILTAGALSGNPVFDATSTGLPVLFSGTVAVQGNDIYLTIARRSAADLGLSVPETAAYDAIYANAINNSGLATSLLQVADTSTLAAQIDRLLPDYSGGVFDFVTRGSRLASRHIEDASSLFSIDDVGGWFEPLYFKAKHDGQGTTPWSSHGFGLSGGIERRTGLGNFGMSFTWMTGKIGDGSWQDISANTYELAAFWRTRPGPLYAYARVGADRVIARSTRTFIGTVNGAALNYSSSGRMGGWALTGDAGLTYTVALPGNFSLRPLAAIEYARLHERGYTETGASAIDLSVQPRSSDSLTARTTLTAAWSVGRTTEDSRPLTIELEGGRRNQVSGKLGDTTAAFDGGNPFTITPDRLNGSWLGEARLLMGGFDYTWQLAGGAEQASGKPDYSLRASLSMAF